MTIPATDPWTTKSIRIFRTDGTFQQGTPADIFGPFSGGDWKRISLMVAYAAGLEIGRPWVDQWYNRLSTLRARAVGEDAAILDSAIPLFEVKLEDAIRIYVGSTPLVPVAAPPPPAPC